jgi:hypothetical protein
MRARGPPPKTRAAGRPLHPVGQDAFYAGVVELDGEDIVVDRSDSTGAKFRMDDAIANGELGRARPVARFPIGKQRIGFARNNAHVISTKAATSLSAESKWERPPSKLRPALTRFDWTARTRRVGGGGIAEAPHPQVTSAGRLTLLLTQASLNQRVPGSSPGAPTNDRKRFSTFQLD